jgi:hypothetical protein
LAGKAAPAELKNGDRACGDWIIDALRFVRGSALSSKQLSHTSILAQRSIFAPRGRVALACLRG